MCHKIVMNGADWQTGEAPAAYMLAALRVHGVAWRDLGEPKRVAATQRGLQWQPAPA